MKRTISALCALILMITLMLAATYVADRFNGEAPTETHAPVEGNKLSFTNLVEDMKALDGQTVTLAGYMSTDISTTGNIIYVMKAPCRETPFTEDNSVQLADTLAVHLTKKSSPEFTEKLIVVEGTLTFEKCTDIRGYTYGYYLKNGTYTVADAETLKGTSADWQKLTESGIIEKINRMYAYADFACNWTTTLNGNAEYTAPIVALYNIQTEDAIYYYGYEEGYFDGIIEEINALEGDFSALVNNVEKAKAISEKAVLALQNNEYSLSEDGSGMYVHKNGDEIKNEYAAVYAEYSQWLEGWSL